MDTSPSGKPSSATYMSGRIRWSRPQAMLWSDNAGTSENGVRYPYGVEKENFIICSDHNRSEININNQRIETRQRMINGTMRSYHVADKITLSLSWDRLPSRSFSKLITFDELGRPTNGAEYTIQNYSSNGLPNPNYASTISTEYTVDGGAGGVELLDWYENHSGPFYVFLAYDKFNSESFKTGGQVTDTSFQHLGVYNDVRQMYFSSFEYTIQKRGGTNFDLWSVSVSLEEV